MIVENGVLKNVLNKDLINGTLPVNAWNGVCEIGSFAFKDCDKLEFLCVPNQVKVINQKI